MAKSIARSRSNCFRILRKSPIVEATFQVNFAMKRPITDVDFKSFVKTHFAGYEFKEEIYSESIAVKKKALREPPETITHHQNLIGVRFVKDNRVLTLFTDGFAFGILKPYPTDESFFAEISSVTKKFFDQHADAPVTRIGLRYINRFAVDATEHAPGKLFTTVPSLPSRLGYGDPLQFLYQDVFRDRETGVVVVSNRLYPSNGPDTPHEPKAVLDIDASLMPNQVLDESGFEKSVVCLRYAVNKTFFGSVRKSVIEELA